MSVIKFIRDIEQYFKYPSDDNPTTQQDYQNAVRNWVAAEGNLVDCVLWQPTTAYAVGNMVKTPSLPSQYCLICTTAGTSGNSEPTYTGVSVGDSVTDGSVTWKVSGYLPVTGGTMTGNIFTNSADFRLVNNRTNNSGRLFFMGGNGSSAGASMALCGAGYATANGYFIVTAHDGTNSKALIGRPNGVLTWDGHSIVHEQAKEAENSYTLSSSNSYTNTVSITVSAGTWIFCAQATFPSNATGGRWLEVGTSTNVIARQSNPAITGDKTDLNASGIFRFTNSTTVYVRVKQNSSSSLSGVLVMLTAQKLSDYTSIERGA